MRRASLRRWSFLVLVLAFYGCTRDADCDKSKNRRDYHCVDIAIVTVIPEEYRAMLRKIDATPVPPACQNCADRYSWVQAQIPDKNSNQTYRVVVGMAGEAGTTSGALTVQRAISRFRPRYLLLVGVAGGLPDKLKQGDVVLATSIWGYDYGAVDTEFRPRQDFTFRSDPRLLAAGEQLRTPWQDEIRRESPEPERRPELHAGQVASGNKVIEYMGSGFANSVTSANGQIVAVEMEGAGAAAAVEEARSQGEIIGLLMIRGISDVPQNLAPVFGDKKDREKWKAYAADAAASYAYSLIRDNWPEPAR